MQVEKDWEAIFWHMAKGDITQLKAIKATNEVEFYELMDLYKDDLDKLKNRQHA